MLVSVHLAKTAGTSFAATLAHHFGAALITDYADLPMNSEAVARNTAAARSCLANAQQEFAGVKCIHGHFQPLKYLLLPQRTTKFITWMRHPVDRVLSNYHYWLKSYDAANSPALHRRVVEENWSIERFCLGEEFKNYYCQMLFGFPIDYFAFIGVTECYEEDLDFFTRHYLNTTSPALKINVGDTGGSGYALDPALKNKIEAFHAKDMALYRSALEMRHLRRALPLLRPVLQPGVPAQRAP